jgi:molybdopterin molybdotransferase
MGVFLTVVPVDRAREIIRSIAPTPQGELLPLEEAAGRVLARDATADADIPGFDRSIVDGFAVQARETQGASDAIPSMLRCTGRITMGGKAPHAVASGECLAIPTGAALPSGADAVVMLEYSERIGDEVLVRRSAATGENVLVRGEDFTRGCRVLLKGRILSPQDLGVLAATGNDRVLVTRRPVVGIISTGNELVPITGEPGAGQVRDANSYLCAGFVHSRGGMPRLYGIVRDERQALGDALAAAARECDAVFLSGG